MGKQVTVAIADGYDVDSLADLRASWNAGVDTTADPFFRAEFRTWFEAEQAHRQFWLAFCDGEPVGMVNLLIFDRMPASFGPSGGWAYLGNMFVRESFRNDGVGAQLLATVLGWADNQQLERVVLNPSERSVAFYERHGFVDDNRLLVRSGPTPTRKRNP